MGRRAWQRVRLDAALPAHTSSATHRPTEAPRLSAIEEAVQIRRELAAARPDAFLPDLAASLNNQSNALADLGRREDALSAIEEAVGHYRELAAARPDAFLPNLATSVNNLAIQLGELRRREEALALARKPRRSIGSLLPPTRTPSPLTSPAR
jgi:tetratricopeptide (TPR) repeat protein